MDTLNQQPNVPEQSETPPASAAVSANQTAKPEPHVSDADVQALLMITNQKNSQRPRSKRPTSLLITTLILVVLVIVASYAVGSLKHGTKAGTSNSSSSLGGTNQSTSSNSQTQSVTNQVNQDVKSCSNLSTAVSQC